MIHTIVQGMERAVFMGIGLELINYFRGEKTYAYYGQIRLNFFLYVHICYYSPFS